MTRERRGFTLLEIMVALVITGIVALSAYATLGAGITTRERIDGSVRDRESALIARAMLEDALRHIVDRGADGDAVARADGPVGDALTFDTRGIREPLGASGLWRVEVHGATISAMPIEAPGPALHAVFSGTRGIRVSGLGPDGWRADPVTSGHLPAALRVDFLAVAGEPPLAPIIVISQGGFAR